MHNSEERLVKVQVSALADEPYTWPAFRQEKWDEFVQSCGLEKVTLYEYYGYCTSQGSYYMFSRVEQERILMELFLDAVAVGAILLSSDCPAEGFALSRTHDDDPRYDGQKINFLVKGQPELRAEYSQICYYINEKSDTMGAEAVRCFLFHFVHGMRSLLKVARGEV